jgi:hypothetical protein
MRITREKSYFTFMFLLREYMITHAAAIIATPTIVKITVPIPPAVGNDGVVLFFKYT